MFESHGQWPRHHLLGSEVPLELLLDRCPEPADVVMKPLLLARRNPRRKRRVNQPSPRRRHLLWPAGRRPATQRSQLISLGDLRPVAGVQGWRHAPTEAVGLMRQNSATNASQAPRAETLLLRAAPGRIPAHRIAAACGGGGGCRSADLGLSERLGGQDADEPR